MKVEHHDAVDAADVEMEGAVGCRVRWLIGEEDGAPNFAMRQFEVAVGGHTPNHRHDYEHEVYVLDGEGEVVDDGSPRPIRKGDVIYVAPNDVHQFRNTGDRPMSFLCLVPNASAGRPQQVVPECESVANRTTASG